MKNIMLITSFVFSVFSTVVGQEIHGISPLQTYIDQAEENNPELQAYRLRYEIAIERVNEVNNIPNTNMAVGYFVSEPETRTGAQRAKFSISQMLPWFGTITARENYAGSMAETEFAEIAIAKRKLTLSVAQAYYQLFANKAKQQVLEENIALLKMYEQLALTGVEVGSASAVDVLQLQIRQNELLEQKEILQEAFMAEQTSFNRLLNRDENEEVAIPDELELPVSDHEDYGDTLFMNPELVKYDKLYESVTHAELLNQKESGPSLGFGLDYIPVSERPDMTFSDNGKDILMPMVSVSIPIFNNKFSSSTRQNELRQMEISSMRQERINGLETALARAQAKRKQTRITYETQLKNIKQAKIAEDILLKNYETGIIDFNDVLDIQQLQLKFGLNRIEALEMYYRQSAVINYLVN